tara:strand:+ start:575 stop:712 length:138 start_codon:yes stop_codon:yes gene_type:complete
MTNKKDDLDKWMDKHLVIIGLPNKKEENKVKKHLKDELVKGGLND